LGCIVGAFTADACGSFVEFTRREVSEEEMDLCMTMPGGGTWNRIGPGQATDDSELAMSLMHALIKSSQLS